MEKKWKLRYFFDTHPISKTASSVLYRNPSHPPFSYLKGCSDGRTLTEVEEKWKLHVNANFQRPQLWSRKIFSHKYIYAPISTTQKYSQAYICIYAPISIPIHAKLVKNQSIGIRLQNLGDGDAEVTLLFGNY